MGFINDKFGTKASLSWLFGCGAAAMVIMLFVNSNAMAIAFAMFFGLCMPMGGNLITMLTSRVFGQKAFPQMLGVMNGAKSLISMFAPIALGFMFDFTGGYNVPCAIVAVVLVIGCLAGLSAIKMGDKMQQEAAAEVREE